MKLYNKKFWIKCGNSLDSSSSNGGGKWVVFIGRSNNQKNKRQENLIDLVEKISRALPTGEAWISKNFDIALFFTSCDRFEIWKSKRIIKQELKISDTDLQWKANFETDEDWEKTGLLKLVNELADTYERISKYLISGRKYKAERIQEREVSKQLTEIRKQILQQRIGNRKKMIITPSFTTVDYEIEPNLAFVIMPFKEDWSKDLFFVLTQAIESEDMKVIRADDIFSSGIVVNDIWTLINRAGLIFADISVHNANVFYELGICHTLGKKVVLLRQNNGENAPFDIAFWRYFNYGLKATEVEELKITVKKIIANYRNELNKIYT
jgi:hypothetical protein